MRVNLVVLQIMHVFAFLSGIQMAAWLALLPAPSLAGSFLMHRLMWAAHSRASSVVAVYTRNERSGLKIWIAFSSSVAVTEMSLRWRKWGSGHSAGGSGEQDDKEQRGDVLL